MDFQGPTKLVLVIRSSSYQDIVIHVQYYSKPNKARTRTSLHQAKIYLKSVPLSEVLLHLRSKFYCTLYPCKDTIVTTCTISSAVQWNLCSKDTTMTPEISPVQWNLCNKDTTTTTEISPLQCNLCVRTQL